MEWKGVRWEKRGLRLRHLAKKLQIFFRIRNRKNFQPVNFFPERLARPRMAERAGSFLQGLQKKRLALWEKVNGLKIFPISYAKKYL